jgi:hypothetical protein
MHLALEYLGDLLVVMAVHGHRKTIVEVDSRYSHLLTRHDATFHAGINGLEFDFLPIDSL